MLTCPLCQKELPEPAPRCPRCQADLSLLTNYMADLRTLLDRADAHRRAGELAAAVQTYCNVLEVDPTNTEAQAALGPVLQVLHVLGKQRRRSSVALLLAGALIGVAAFAAGVWFSRWATL